MTTNKAKVYYKNALAGVLEKMPQGYIFTYDPGYVANKNSEPISITMPVTERPCSSKTLFPFFKGLIPEGWLFEMNSRILKIAPNDEFAMLIHTAGECVGAVSVLPEEEG